MEFTRFEEPRKFPQIGKISEMMDIIKYEKYSRFTPHYTNVSCESEKMKIVFSIFIQACKEGKVRIVEYIISKYNFDIPNIKIIRKIEGYSINVQIQWDVITYVCKYSSSQNNPVVPIIMKYYDVFPQEFIQEYSNKEIAKVYFDKWVEENIFIKEPF